MSIRTLDPATVARSTSRHKAAEVETAAALIDQFKKGDRVVVNYDGAKQDPTVHLGTVTKRNVAGRTLTIRFDDGITEDVLATSKWILGKCINNKVRKTAIPVKDLPKWISPEDVNAFLNKARPKVDVKPKVVPLKPTVTPVQSRQDKANPLIPSVKVTVTPTSVKTVKLDKVAKGPLKMKAADALKEYEKTYRSLYNKQMRKHYINKYVKGENTYKLTKEISDLEVYAQQLEKATGDLAACSKIRRNIIVMEESDRQAKFQKEFQVQIEQYKPDYF